MKKNITMKVLMETMKKLEKEANYKSFLPDPKKKNFVMSVDKLAALAAADERDSEEHLDNIYKDSEKEREPTKKDYIPGTGNVDLQGDEDFTTVGGRHNVSEIDFGGPGDETTTMAYNDEDTVPDGASTTDMVDALSDQVIAQLDNAGVLPLDISQEDAKDKVEDALMSVLKDMDATDLFDRS